MLGFKQIDLHLFFKKVVDLGGYDGCVSKKSWKSVYDELGGNPQNTSAATCTRRHYEKFLLSYERYSKNMELDGPEEEIKIKQDDIETDEIKPENCTNGLIDSVESLVADTKSDSDIKEVSDDNDKLIESKSEDK